MSRQPYTTPKAPSAITLELEAGKVFLVEALPPAHMLQEWSKQVSGTVILGDYYFNHSAGHHSETYILPKRTNPITGEVDNVLEKIYSAREAVRKLVGPKSRFYESPGWTFSRMARNINEWLNIPTDPIDEIKLLVQPWHYEKCYPGIYDHAYLYDMSAAYWQMVERAPSPYFMLWNGKIAWEPLSVEQARRWKRLIRFFADGNNKRLRLAIVGANAAGWDSANVNAFGTAHFSGGTEAPSKKATIFRRGEPKPFSNRPGDLQALSLLAVRCTYELCQIQSMISESVYSNADCVCTETPGPMAYWDEFGIKYKLKAEGKADIRAMQTYKIGDVFTAKYPRALANDVQWGFEPNNLTDTSWHTQLLKGTL